MLGYVSNRTYLYTRIYMFIINIIEILIEVRKLTGV